MEKIRVLFIQAKRINKKTKVRTIGDIIEMVAPDRYEFTYITGRDDITGTIKELEPEIVFLNSHKTIDVLSLIREIKSLRPLTAIFVMLSEMDDDQERIDEYQSAGAYKCVFSTLSIEALVHDMYVALNLE